MKAKKNSEFKIGEIVVYPKHGVGEITQIENMEISNIKTSFYVVKMEQFLKKNYRRSLFYIKT